MAYTTIDKPGDYFNTVLYTGTGASHAISVGFKPDLVWIKWRGGSNNHKLQDVIRGVTKAISSNTTGAEATDSPSITSFDTNGFTLGIDSGDYNTTSRDYASWNFLAGGTASSNTDGSITSSVSANTTSGFSIVSYTGNFTSGATVGHGLGVAPKMIIVKNYDEGSESWQVYHGSLGATKYLNLNLTSAAGTNSNRWNNTEPTSSVFTNGANGATNGTSQSHIAYCFADVKGFSKMGSYTGNGNADGSFIYTGFSPAFVMIKETTGTGKWVMKDNRRTGINVNQSTIYANETDAEGTPGYELIDLLSNGFKQRGTGSYVNGSGTPYIYMAFAENPFVSSTAIPACAR